MMDIGAPSSRILLPARRWFIALTMAGGLMINLLPVSYVPWLPDFAAFVLCFWAIREPRHIGMGVAALFGVLMDVAAGSVMGQHVLAYVVLAYLAGAVSRRVMWFTLSSQAAHVLALLFVATLVEIVSGMLGGGEFPGWLFVFGPLLGAALWVPATYLFLLPQYQPLERDENRPI